MPPRLLCSGRLAGMFLPLQHSDVVADLSFDGCKSMKGIRAACDCFALRDILWELVQDYGEAT